MRPTAALKPRPSLESLRTASATYDAATDSTQNASAAGGGSTLLKSTPAHATRSQE